MADIGLKLLGSNLGYALTPDSAAVSMTGDIDIRVQSAMSSWTPAIASNLAAKYLSPSNRSYGLNLTTAGLLQFFYSVAGATVVAVSSTVSVTMAAGTTKWVRATMDVDNGAAGNDVKFYTSDTNGSWTQLGATVTTAGTISIFDGTASLEVGSSEGGTVNNTVGLIYEVDVRNNILDNGTGIVANPKFYAQPVGTRTFTDSNGNVWSLGLRAQITDQPKPVNYQYIRAGNGMSVSERIH